jgi:DNA repair protein RadC
MNYNMLNATELIAPIAGHQQAYALMEHYGTLTALARADEAEYLAVPGIGAHTAKAIKSALTLAQKLTQETFPESPLLDCPEKVADFLREEMRTQRVEAFTVLLLNVRRRLIKAVRVSDGTLDSLLVHPREVFMAAIVANAAGIVLAHNHPSGDATPSEADIRITRDLIRAGQLLRIDVIDHIIIGLRTPDQPKDYSSLRELGLFSSQT